MLTTRPPKPLAISVLSKQCICVFRKILAKKKTDFFFQTASTETPGGYCEKLILRISFDKIHDSNKTDITSESKLDEDHDGFWNVRICVGFILLMNNQLGNRKFSAVLQGLDMCFISKRFTSLEIINCRIITETTFRKQILLPSSGIETSLTGGLLRYSSLGQSQNSLQGCPGQYDGCLVTEGGDVWQCKASVQVLPRPY
jgi:hypothetical protein